MELKINEVALPAPITFNYEELKSELLHKVSVYETMVYTEDQVKEAKADRAALNRLKKALNDERIRQEKEYMQPFNTFKAQIAELVKIIDNSVSVVDKQVKEFDEKKKAEKLDTILEYFGIALAAKLPSVPLNHRLVVDDKWLNASVSMKSIHSPSKVFAGIGGFMAEGLGDGFSDEFASVKNDIEGSMSFDAGTITADANIGKNYASSSNAAQSGGGDYSRIIALLEQYLPMLANMKVVMDNGQLVGVLAPGLDVELGKINARRVRTV